MEVFHKGIMEIFGENVKGCIIWVGGGGGGYEYWVLRLG